MSFSQPSHVSATTGSDHHCSVSGLYDCKYHAMTASRATPTLCVLVITIGPHSSPDSSIHVVPVISPLPFCENQPAYTGWLLLALPLGRTAVTPVRTGPEPTLRGPFSPEISVTKP